MAPLLECSTIGCPGAGCKLWVARESKSRSSSPKTQTVRGMQHPGQCRSCLSPALQCFHPPYTSRKLIIHPRLCW